MRSTGIGRSNALVPGQERWKEICPNQLLQQPHETALIMFQDEQILLAVINSALQDVPISGSKRHKLAEHKNIWNYLFTSILLNVNAWKTVLTDPDCALPTFPEFCDELALDILERLCFQ